MSRSGVLRLCATALQALEEAAAHPMTDAERAQAYANARATHRRAPDLVDRMHPTSPAGRASPRLATEHVK